MESASPKPHLDTDSRLQITRLTAVHSRSLAEFFRAVWGSHVPHAVPTTPAFGALRHDRLIAYIGTLPVRFRTGSSDGDGYWMKGLMVLPEFRKCGMGFFVLKEAMQHLSVVGSLCVATDARRLFEAVGLQHVGVVTDTITVLRPWRFFRALDPDALLDRRFPPAVMGLLRIARKMGLLSITGALLAAPLGAWRALRRVGLRQLTIAQQRPTDDELDNLWRTAGTAMGHGPVRDAAYLSARYPSGDESIYQFVAVRDGAEFCGVAVVRHPRCGGDPRLNGIRVAVVSELVVDPANAKAMVALIDGAEAVARAGDADALLCATTNPQLTRLLSQQGYVRFPGNLHFLFRSPHGPPAPMAHWWLTRGDGHADEVF